MLWPLRHGVSIKYNSTRAILSCTPNCFHRVGNAAEITSFRQYASYYGTQLFASIIFARVSAC